MARLWHQRGFALENRSYRGGNVDFYVDEHGLDHLNWTMKLMIPDHRAVSLVEHEKKVEPGCECVSEREETRKLGILAEFDPEDGEARIRRVFLGYSPPLGIIIGEEGDPFANKVSYDCRERNFTKVQVIYDDAFKKLGIQKRLDHYIPIVTSEAVVDPFSVLGISDASHPSLVRLVSEYERRENDNGP